MTGDVVRFPSLAASISPKDAQAAAHETLATPIPERIAKRSQLHLDQSETFLCLCQLLDEQMETAPASVLEEASFFYELLEKLDGSNTSFLFDERDYYRGQFAYLAGGACRFLTRREEARRWLDRAEAWFLLTANAAGEIARLTYQRLALKMEERQFADVLRLLAPLSKFFTRANASDFALKCRYLEAVALREVDQRPKALEVFQRIVLDAQELHSEHILGSAFVAMIHIHLQLADAEAALSLVAQATPLLLRLNNRVALAKLQRGVATLLRRQGRLAESIEAYRASQQEFMEIGMRADVAALHFAIADLLLEDGQERQAEREIRAALPVIDELKMVPEGMAALSLLRASLRGRSIDRQALRDLHAYFDDTQS
ncbi:MAG: hypothetical protein ACRD1P_12895 [Thermoanaerobaculia bacterium]